jgi:hypothetical protein
MLNMDPSSALLIIIIGIVLLITGASHFFFKIFMPKVHPIVTLSGYFIMGVGVLMLIVGGVLYLF